MHIRGTGYAFRGSLFPRTDKYAGPGAGRADIPGFSGQGSNSGLRFKGRFCPEMDFVRLSSYADNVNSGRMVFSKDMEMSIKNRHVLLVEDIVDTGYSMEFLSKVLDARQPASVSICSLIDKTERRQTEVEVDYPGFVLEKGFIVGYGLDYAERYRELPGIFEVRFEE
jgi:hypoxanthine phosphoribosyltransferase